MTALHVVGALLLLAGSALALWAANDFPKEDLGHVSPTWRAPIERPHVDPNTLGRIKDLWAEADHRAAKSRIRRVS